MFKVRRGAVLVLAMVVALSLTASASAQTSPAASASCTKTVLLLPAATTKCTTPVVACPAPPSGVRDCFYTAKAVANAAVGISVAAKAVATSTSSITSVFNGVEQGTDSYGFTSEASCSAALALLRGCTAQTPTTVDNYGIVGQGTIPTPVGDVQLVYRSSGQGACQWTGGRVAVVVSLTCTARADYGPV